MKTKGLFLFNALRNYLVSYFGKDYVNNIDNWRYISCGLLVTLCNDCVVIHMEDSSIVYKSNNVYYIEAILSMSIGQHFEGQIPFSLFVKSNLLMNYGN